MDNLQDNPLIQVVTDWDDYVQIEVRTQSGKRYLVVIDVEGDGPDELRLYEGEGDDCIADGDPCNVIVLK